MNEIISVIIPIYNGEKTLERCINSILSSILVTLDVILVDDGSTDNSILICKKFKDFDSRVSLYCLKNSGVSRARNFGISKAKGKYICFIDFDDYVSNKYFFDLYNNYNLYKADLSVGSIANIQNNTTEYLFAFEGLINLRDKSIDNQKKFFELHKKYLLYGPVNKLYIADYIRENDITFPEGMEYGEDLIFNLKYLNLCETISYKRNPVYYYDHSNVGSLSQKYRPDLFENGIMINKALIGHFKKLSFWGDDEKDFVYRRIFDDAYNSLFNLWSPNCSLEFYKKVLKAKDIMNNNYLRKACKIADIHDYSKIYSILIKYRRYVIFSICREIMKLLHS